MKLEIVKKCEVLDTAKFLFNIPAGVDREKIRGLVVLAPGSNGDGRSMALAPRWVEFAEQHSLALVGCYLRDKDPNDVEGYCQVQVESGPALLWAIREASEQLRADALNAAPLLMWGHSAGGQFAYEMNAKFPQRVAAFVANKGGMYYTALVPERARMNHGLLITGEKDAPFRKQILKALWGLNAQRLGAPWITYEEQGIGHDEGRSAEIGREFFAGVLKKLGGS